MFEYKNNNKYELIFLTGLIMLICFENESVAMNITNIEKINKITKSYIINNLCGELSLKQFFNIIDLIDSGIIINLIKNIRDLIFNIIKKESKKNFKNNNKIKSELLTEFFLKNQGNWFKLSDFEIFFGVNKKTAWCYLNNMLKNGVLIHNNKKANKARYFFIKDNININLIKKKQTAKNNELPFDYGK